jgi:hypothetical protein
MMEKNIERFLLCDFNEGQCGVTYKSSAVQHTRYNACEESSAVKLSHVCRN